MTDLLPSSRPQRLITRLLAPFLIFLFLTASAFTPGRIVSKADDSEAMQLREFITGYAQNFLGLKYRHGGVSPNTGFDCSGFTGYVLKEFDIKVSSCALTQSSQGMHISLDKVLPGDLVFFGKGKHIQHVAMVVERNEEGIFVVHSTCSRGIMVENISTSKYWRPKLLFARDIISQQLPQAPTE